jgi:hypothetical protein
MCTGLSSLPVDMTKKMKEKIKKSKKKKKRM